MAEIPLHIDHTRINPAETRGSENSTTPRTRLSATTPGLVPSVEGEHRLDTPLDAHAKIRITRGIIEDFRSKSGITIEYYSDKPPEKQFFIGAPKPNTEITDEEAIQWAINDGMPASFFEGEDREINIENARYMKRSEFVRYTGITSRGMHEARYAFPNFDDLLKQNRGKTVILGNGFSDLPLYLAQKYAAGELAERPVIDDLLDYRLAEEDFLDLQERFAEKGVAFPFSLQLSRTTGILDAVESGNLEAVQYTVGKGNPPSQLMDASLLINIYGPAPKKTLDEQLSMLAPGGSLLITDVLIDSHFELITEIPGFTLKPLRQLTPTSYTSMITKC